MMAHVASSLASKLKSWLAIDDSFTTDGKVVICQVCNKKIGCFMKSQLEQNTRSARHTKHTLAVFQEASTCDSNATRIWNQELIFQRLVQCNGGRRYSVVQTPSAKVSFTL
jgi:hypothetical protein